MVFKSRLFKTKAFCLPVIIFFLLSAYGPDLLASKIEQEKLHWYSHEQTVFFNIPAKVSFAIVDNKDSDIKARKIINQVDSIYKQINDHFNAFDKNSELYNINNSTEKQIGVSTEFRSAFEISQYIYLKSGEYFDISVWPLKMLWSKAKKSGKLPTDKEIKTAANKCGLNKAFIEANTLHRTSDIQLDFGGIVKGYAVDRISSMLKAQGVANALVQCGGEIRSFGKNSKGNNFKIGIQHPLSKTEIYGFVSSEKGYAISTSGNYRQPIVIEGKNYYHIFNPKTGEPVSTDILGVSVIVPEKDFANSYADGFATAITALGIKEGLKLLVEMGYEALILVKEENSQDGIKPVMSKGFEKMFTKITR